MTDRRDPRDPFPPLPAASPLRIDPSEIDLARPFHFRNQIRVQREAFFLNQVFIDAVLQHFNLRESDDPDFPLKALIYDIQGGVGRILWADATSGSVVFTTAMTVAQDGTVSFLGGIGGAETARVTADGSYGLANAAGRIDQDINGFTNTVFADLDALATVAGSAISVPVTTGTLALVIVSAATVRNTTGGQNAVLGYRVSGATTIAAVDGASAQGDANVGSTRTFAHPVTLTAGVNTFELQARVTANAGRITNPSITVIPLDLPV